MINFQKNLFMLIFLRGVLDRFGEIRREQEHNLRVDAQIVGYHIKDSMLDLGSDVNILSRKTLEVLEKPKLVFSPI